MSCAHCEDLKERVAWLEGELGLSERATVAMKLRAAQPHHTVRSVGNVDMLAALYAAKGKVLNKWQLLDATTSPSGKDDRDVKIVDIWVCHLRRNLGRDTIATAWGRGYSLTETGMAKVAAILGEAE